MDGFSGWYMDDMWISFFWMVYECFSFWMVYGWYVDGIWMFLFFFPGWYMDARLMVFSGWYMDGRLMVFSG